MLTSENQGYSFLSKFPERRVRIKLPVVLPSRLGGCASAAAWAWVSSAAMFQKTLFPY